MRRGAWPVALVALGCVAAEPPDPTADVISGLPACRDCRVGIHEVATLGSAVDPGSISEEVALEPCAVARLSSGEFVGAAPVGGGRLVVYDPLGRFARSVGRPGRGPGELAGGARVMVGPGDTLHVLDNGNARLQVLTPDGAYVRSFRLPSRMSYGALLDGGGYVLHPIWSTITDAGQPVHQLYSAEGRLMAEVSPWDGVRSEWGEDWIVSPTKSGGFWEGKESRLEARLWAANGTLEGSVRMETEWFPRDATSDPAFPFSPPPAATLSHIWEDDQSRLWLFVLGTSTSWRPWPGAEEGRYDLPVSWIEEMFFTRIEVIDLTRRQLIASDSTDFVLMPMCGNSLMYAATAGPDGDTRVTVFDLSLEGS